MGVTTAAALDTWKVVHCLWGVHVHQINFMAESGGELSAVVLVVSSLIVLVVTRVNNYLYSPRWVLN